MGVFSGALFHLLFHQALVLVNIIIYTKINAISVLSKLVAEMSLDTRRLT